MKKKKKAVPAKFVKGGAKQLNKAKIFTKNI